MSGRIDFTMGFNAGKTAKAGGDSSYRVYVFGNFSGASAPWEQSKIRKIDVDNFEQVMAQILPALEVSPGISLQFATLEDFNPDAWLGKIKLLADLRTLKSELGNPNTAAQAAAKIQAFFPAVAASEPVTPALETESQDDMLERLLGKKPEGTVTASDSLDSLLKQIVEPHVARDANPQHQALIDLIDAATAQFVKALLHRQDFQALEALWLATDGLVHEEAADAQQLYLLDISQAQLLAELEKGGESVVQRLQQHMQTGDGEQDVLFVADYLFSDNAEDKTLLGFCADLAAKCGAGFLAGAGNGLVVEALQNAADWLAYRQQIQADSVILTYPRVLMRLPYGSKREPLETFAFEECDAVPQTDELLWGNPAFLAARVLLRAAQDNAVAEQFFFADAPAFSYELDGEQLMQPATEVVLNEAQANNLLAQNIMPVIGYRQRQGLRLLGLDTLS
ncbi:type VI secretion system contractile sheath large subunit [Methylomonas sp. EFPC1]|uniref:type VI secretion system contractile sheath domain-containing protein n=1 Tax=Methylomonas sp. EFPC1 TaxID=2812647 RepID=UPI001967162A|nr:type VI secretion system contractile sheath large subunit [Methylomonas sp. EFPC1]QSB02691.1 type VI secretion system contractile sheath large subunit [Methylomonas sp. EFPC1]